MDAETGPRVRVRASRGLGHVTLDRPRAINALDLGMTRAVSSALEEWDRSDEVRLVLLDGAGDRGFCAGGDVRALAEQMRAGDAGAAQVFFAAEYALNARIAEHPVPIVAIADGVTMGGGIGLAGHAALRVVTERSQLAMPETRIGLTPDVGGSLLLGRAPGRVGEYLALTGASMDAADALYAGFADHFVPVAALPTLYDALAGAAAEGAGDPDLRDLVRSLASAPSASRLAGAREWIDETFSADSVAAIIDRLRSRPEPAASVTADALEQNSPTALTVTLESVRRARTLPSLRAALAQEYELMLWLMHTQPDPAEGIRAQLIDKDRSPRWQPSTLGGVPRRTVEEAFAFRPSVPLWG